MPPFRSFPCPPAEPTLLGNRYAEIHPPCGSMRDLIRNAEPVFISAAIQNNKALDDAHQGEAASARSSRMMPLV